MESWKYSCLMQFYHSLGMPTEGFEREILKFFKKMNEKIEHFEKLAKKKRKGQKPSKFDRKLKKLQCSVNYC